MFFADIEWKKICINCWKKNKNISTPKANNPQIDEDMLPLLIRLCHPDKHNNSEAANRVTAYLLSLRRKK